jgi:hypothetical protein
MAFRQGDGRKDGKKVCLEDNERDHQGSRETQLTQSRSDSITQSFGQTERPHPTMFGMQHISVVINTHVHSVRFPYWGGKFLVKTGTV